MRITFLANAPNLSGGQRVVALHAERLAALGHEVRVICVASKPSRGGRRFGPLGRLAAGLRAPRPPRREETHFGRMTGVDLRLLDRPGPFRPEDVPDGDVVVASWWEHAFSAAALPPRKGAGHYFVQHHEVHAHLPAHISAGSYHLPLRKIAVSGWLRDLMRTRYGDDDVALVPNAVDHGLFHAPPRGRAPVPTVGLMHADTPFKGVDVALEAIALARRRLPELETLAFGRAPPGRDLPLPPGARFELRPDQARLRELYAACDVWIAASRSEGFGLPILEALACRTPVVATRAGCAPDAIEDGVNGRLAPVDDAAALAEGLLDMLGRDEAGWRAMSEAAAASVAGYGWDEAAARFEAALRPAPDARPSRPAVAGASQATRNSGV